MLDISDLLDYTQDDCVIDIFDYDLGVNLKESLSISEARNWAENHSYELGSFEPIQRDDTERGHGVVFGIVFNVGNVEEL